MTISDIYTNEKAIAFEYNIDCEQPPTVQIIGYNQNKKKAIYFNRTYIGVRGGEQTIDVLLPVTPEKMEQKIILPQHCSLNNITTRILPRPHLQYSHTTKLFIELLIWFAKNAFYLPYDKYFDAEGKSSINYTADIVDEKEGLVFTPMRVDHLTGQIDIAGNFIKNSTVCGIIIVGMHEWAHYATGIRTEKECDIIAVDFALNFGFSGVECLQAFTTLFPDSEDNNRRIDDIDNYILNWQRKHAFVRG